MNENEDGQLELFPWATTSRIDRILDRLLAIDREVSRHWDELYWIIYRTNLTREEPVAIAKMFEPYNRRIRRYGTKRSGGRKASNEATRLG